MTTDTWHWIETLGNHSHMFLDMERYTAGPHQCGVPRRPTLGTPKIRFHLAWLQVIFIHIHSNKLEATWLDRAEGFCQWKSECEPHDDASLLIGGLTNLYCHLCMLSRPFVLQIVVPYHNTWRIVTSNMDKLRHMLLKSDYASWYQLFPLSETDCRHRSMRQCLTNFSSSPF